jgi:hypothetical protein
MANLHRGEIDAELGEKTYTLCLTLGALAELEAAFGVDDLTALAACFENGALSARDLLRIIACGMRGGGNTMSNEEVASLTVSEGLHGYASIAARLLAATFGDAASTRTSSASPP